MRFIIKHAVAGALVVVGAVALSVVTYFGLLGWAILTNEGLGGPLALPGMMVVALVAGIVVAAVFAIVTALAEWICKRRAFSVWRQIPVANLLLGVAIIIAGLLVWQQRGGSGSTAALVATTAFVLLLVPLGAYWWAIQSTEWLLSAGARWMKRVF